MNESVLNLETLKTLRDFSDDGDDGFLREIICAYLENTESRLADAWRALRAGNGADLAAAAHAIKGSSLNVGADGMAALMQSLERDGRRGELPDPGRLRSGEVEFARVKAALAAYLV